MKTYLVSKGVGANRLTAQGMGSTPLVKECDLRKRAEVIACGAPNRRVEVEPITMPKK